MARSTRVNYAKVKVWLPNMSSDMEGPITGIAFELFSAIRDPNDREKILSLMQERHNALKEREAQRANDAVQGVV